MCKHSILSYNNKKINVSTDELRDNIEKEIKGGESNLEHPLIWKSNSISGNGRDDRLRFDIGVMHENTASEVISTMLTGNITNDGYSGPPNPENKLYGDATTAKVQYIHAHVMGRFVCKETGVDMMDIVYAIYFMHNGTLESHAYDVEYIVLRFQYFDASHGGFGYHDLTPLVNRHPCCPEGRQWHLVRVYLSSHGNGVWYPTRFPGEEKTFIKFVDFTHPVIYSANASHALYPSSKRHRRFVGFADDVTDDDGLLWRPTCVAIWGPVMFPINPVTKAQERPSLTVIQNDGVKIRNPDPLLYMNFFRGTFGVIKDDKCIGCQSTLPFKNAINLFTLGDGYYKFQKGGLTSMIKVGTTPAFRAGIQAFAVVSTLSLLAIMVSFTKAQKKDPNHIKLLWLTVILSIVSLPISGIVYAAK
ncbi:MAG: hypothetical protein CL916_03655 [Deltaproteobacteria bacterium]|nr:hypothetical protein [Deltaproteobacteria bacterium]